METANNNGTNTAVANLKIGVFTVLVVIAQRFPDWLHYTLTQPPDPGFQVLRKNS